MYSVRLLSDLVLKSEYLNSVLDGKRLDTEEYLQIYHEASDDPASLMAVAARLRLLHKGTDITFSKKAFFNVINLCRDICTYCTYKSEPSQSKLSMMDIKTVDAMLVTAAECRCVEALLVTGERPEERYDLARQWLKEQGFKSTSQYLVHISERALEAGLFPHTNAGNLEPDEMRELAHTNVSLGVMLENSSARLTQKGMPHHLAPSKIPDKRIRTLRNAGILRIPMTTGILIGIGETPQEAIESLVTIQNIHRKYGHIQEVIIQNFQPKPDTAMRNAAPANETYLHTLVAMCRIIMPDMNIQVPPNLLPDTYHTYLNSGINDWGGISPITPDFVNPEFGWPNINNVRRVCDMHGYTLRCRFPVYPEFIHMVRPALQEKMRAISDNDNLVAEAYWR